MDPGAEMINTARSLGGKTKSGKNIRYEVCAAEACSDLDGVEPGSVDMSSCLYVNCSYGCEYGFNF